MSRSARLSVETLEDRSVPSATALLGPPAIDPIPIAIVRPAEPPITVVGPVSGGPVAIPIVVGPVVPIFVLHHDNPLEGRGHGTFTASPLMVDAGAYFHLHGHGHFGKLGEATVTGFLQGVGMIANGHASGTLTFTNSHGSVTIELKGKLQSAFAEIPTWFAYHVVSGTGSYSHMKDHGMVRIDHHWSPVMLPLDTPNLIFCQSKWAALFASRFDNAPFSRES